MAENVWTDLTGDGAFDDGANWSSSSVPGAGDEAVIQLAGTVTTGGGEAVDTLFLGAGATLIARNLTILGLPDADNATGTTTIAGTLVVPDDASLGIAGTLDNTGMVQFDAGVSGTALDVGNGTIATLTLTGGGTIALTDVGSNAITSSLAGAVLDNADNTIAGAGSIGSSNLDVVNGGTIAATGTAATLILQGDRVTNTALIEAAGPAGLEIRDTVFNAGGTIAAAAGNVDLEGAGAYIVGGTLLGTGGIFVLSGAPALDGVTVGAVTLLGTAEITDGSQAELFGTLVEEGTVLLGATARATSLVVGNGGETALTLTGGGTVAMSDMFDNNIVSGIPHAVLDNLDDTIAGAGDIGGSQAAPDILSVVNAGTIAATGTVNPLFLEAQTVTNTGLLEAAGSAGLVIQDLVSNAGGTILAAGSDVDVSGGQIVGGTLAGTEGIVMLSGAELDGATAGAITLLGTAEIPQNQVTMFGTLDNEGTLLLDPPASGAGILVGSDTGTPLTLDGGGTIALSDVTNNIIIGSGEPTVLDNLDNTIEGAGLLGGNNLSIVNAGTIIATGHAALTVAGSTLTNTGLIEATGPGGLAIVSSSVGNTGTILAAAQSEVTVEGTVTGAGVLAIGAGATMVLQGSVAAGQTVEPAGGATTLRLDAPARFAGSLQGVAAGFTLDLPHDTLTSAVLGASSLELAGDFGSLAVPLIGGTVGESVLVAPDATGGSEVVVEGDTSPPPCFGAGTRIATPGGQVAVEALKRGDLVLTASGEARAIVWTGHRRVDIRRHAAPELVRPVRIAAGAFGGRRPAPDLIVSPDHNLFVDGVLIPAKCLVNGHNVAELDVASVSYHHIELETHDVVLANNMPAETYLDTGNRANFAGEAAMVAHPDFASGPDLDYFTWVALGCAPLVLIGPELEAVRARLAAAPARETAGAISA